MKRLRTSPLQQYLSQHTASPSCRTGFTHLYGGFNPDICRKPAQTFRQSVRNKNHCEQTSGIAPGFIQTNFVALPKDMAFDFLTFCLRNPKPCPLLSVMEPGNPCPQNVAPDADVRTDIPLYRVWRDGIMVEEIQDITHLWSNDMVGFLLGCSFSWEDKLKQAGHCPRHIKEGVNVPMYRTNIPNQQSGPFGGDLVVSMRPFKEHQIEEVAQITGGYAGAHGSPVHWGDPEELGISREELREAPHWGDAVTFEHDDIPVFWACGVTPQTAIMDAALPLAITHSPGHMFVCDLKDDELFVETKIRC